MLILISIILFALSPAAGISRGSSPGILMVFSGFVLLFYALLRPWGKARYYVIMTGIWLIIFSFIFLVGPTIVTKYIHFPNKGGEDILWIFGSASVAGIIAGIAGTLIHADGWQRLIYSGAAFTVPALAVLITCLAPPNLRYSTVVGERILIGIQLLILILLTIVGDKNNSTDRFSRISLLSISIILIIIAFWSFLTAATEAPQRLNVWSISMVIFAVFEIVIAIITLFAWRKSVRKLQV